MVLALSMTTACLGVSLIGPHSPKVNCIDWNILSFEQMQK